MGVQLEWIVITVVGNTETKAPLVDDLECRAYRPLAGFGYDKT